MAAKIKRCFIITAMAVTLPIWLFPLMCWITANEVYDHFRRR